MTSMDAKITRTIAKRLFTRSKNSVESAIERKDDADIIQNRFTEVKRRYVEVEEKHVAYSEAAKDTPGYDPEIESTYINAIEEGYWDIEKKVQSYLKKEESAGLDLKAAVNNRSVEIGRAYSIRSLEKSNFIQEAEIINGVLLNGGTAPEATNTVIIESQKDLKHQLEVCKGAHRNYVTLLDSSEVERELKWMDELQVMYSDVTQKIASFSQKLHQIDREARNKNKCQGLKLERMRLPEFSGDIRNYPQFKVDFQRQVAPQIESQHSISYVLKSCLKGKALDVVKNVDDDLREMWKRLDERYGKASRLVDVVMFDIKNVKTVKEGDDCKFLELVDTVERGYRDLQRVDLQKEISNTTTVSVIEEILPRDIKREWSRLVNKSNTKVDDRDKFPHLLEFLLEQKRIIEYESADLRRSRLVNTSSHHAHIKEEIENPTKGRSHCWIHSAEEHATTECKSYLNKTAEERIRVVKENRACWSCLKLGHRSAACWMKKECGEDGCRKFHHNSLHEAYTKGVAFHTRAFTQSPTNEESRACLLQLMKVKAKIEKDKTIGVNVLWDCGATLSLITFEMARRLQLEGKRVKLKVTKVGGQTEEIDSLEYDLYLIDKNGDIVQFIVYGIHRISTKLEIINISEAHELFKNVTIEEIKRPAGYIEVLIGYEYAGYHPVMKQSVDHLLILENRFGKCMGGSHLSIRERVKKLIQHVSIHHVQCIGIEEFFRSENMGIEIIPKCGDCKCGNCLVGRKNCTLKEEREKRLIEEGLTRKRDHWEVRYPWTRSPSNLPDNRAAALSMLKSTERRLLKNPDHAKLYNEQVVDMVARGAARKLTEEEITEYEGPKFYLYHHDILRPDSISTPCRIVFNSSAKFQGHVLNEYWVKGPDMLNNLLGILIRFRENRIAVTGDIQKMYHSVRISELDQHTHRFLWRNMEIYRKPDTYVMQTVSFGDKPAGAIAAIALRKTAEEGEEDYPRAAKVIKENTYVDDMVDSFDTLKEALEVTQEIDRVIEPAGFKIKRWFITHNNTNEGMLADSELKEAKEVRMAAGETEKVLGIHWDTASDNFVYKVKLNFSPKRRKVRTGPNLIISQIPSGIPLALTKRLVLSVVNGIFDPIGLASPFILKAKILLQRMWINEAKELSWDDPLPNKIREDWVEFFRELFAMDNIEFPRCIRPDNAVGDPILILFSDASEEAAGACAYVRWELENGSYECTLMAAKTRVAPLRKISIVRLELNGALIATRLGLVIKKESRLKFAKTIHIVDSEIVRSMIQKESYGFSTYVAVRIGEIQESTDKSSWYWTESKLNVADYLTRGKHPEELSKGSIWQRGPEFTKSPEDQWPIKQTCLTSEMPELTKRVLNVNLSVTDSLACRICIDKYSKYIRLIMVTARILSMFRKSPTMSFKNALLPVDNDGFKYAEQFWIKEAQQTVELDDKRYKRLCLRRRDDGIIVMGNRAERWVNVSYNAEELIILPYNHRFTRLFVEHTHYESHFVFRGHNGVAATTSKVRLRFWVIGLERMVKSVKYHCVRCRKANKQKEYQKMGQLPMDRLKPAPPWSSTSVDLFGPFIIRGETNKRSRGKAFGVLFTCMLSRAVHLDLSVDYSSDAFLQVLRRFMSIRGSPVLIRSDPGTQLVGANNELKLMIKGLDHQKLNEFGVVNGFQWEFTPADAPWHNGCAEALIRSVKKALEGSIGNQVLMFSELLTVLFEVSNLLNERPIGKQSTDPDDDTYICPNDLLLGRATSRIPSGPFRDTTNPKRRHEFVQRLVDAYWVKWNRYYFPSLLIRQKWHVEKRNVKVGDVVLIQDSNRKRGNWKLGKISAVFPGSDGKVRRVQIQYKNVDDSEPLKIYTGTPYTTIERPVQKIVVILPIDNNDDE